MKSHFDLHNLGESPPTGRVLRHEGQPEKAPAPAPISPLMLVGYVVVFHPDGSYTDIKGYRRGGREVDGINWQASH